MRKSHFAYSGGQEVPSPRHKARASNFNDQSIFSYAGANKNWWGYA